jgi:hypothetical protein
MLNISSLPLPNVVLYWVDICKDKCKLATQCVTNCGNVVLLKVAMYHNFWQNFILGTIWVHQL